MSLSAKNNEDIARIQQPRLSFYLLWWRKERILLLLLLSLIRFLSFVFPHFLRNITQLVCLLCLYTFPSIFWLHSFIHTFIHSFIHSLSHSFIHPSIVEYIPLLKSLGVTCVVRFNSKCYDRTIFLKAKIRWVREWEGELVSVWVLFCSVLCRSHVKIHFSGMEWTFLLWS